MTPLQTLKGFRDFLPAEKAKRDYVANIMRQVYERYGFGAMETPTLEYADLLLGKYGEEADKLVYKFTDRGDRVVALRYDQTVPSARILVQYQNDLPRYFRRYQIQNVFRADKPQRGRYREFTQSDCDIFGSTDSLADAEILAVFYAVYAELGIKDLEIQINDRATLFNTLGDFSTQNVSVLSICQTIDKADKQPITELVDELVSKGLEQTAAKQVFSEVEKADMSNDLQAIVDKSVALGVPREALKFNPKLARGLDYYTGLIFEGRVPEYAAGSIGGGGRYDNLIEVLSGQSIPAVGFGIGFDRTVEAVEQLGLLPNLSANATALVSIFSEELAENSLEVANQLRQAGIKTEVYPAIDKLGKQFKMADQKGIPYCVIIGEDEAEKNLVTLKDLKTGNQTQLSIEEAIKKLSG